MEKLYRHLAPLSSQPECQACRKCEENVGLVYLLGKESEKIGGHGLRVLRTAVGVEYLERTEEGWCSAFDVSTGTCRTYSERPLCCRIYPLDLMKLDGVIWWVIHSECPIAQRFQREKRLGILAAMTAAMERDISDDELNRWLLQDRFSQQVEAFSFDPSSVLRLRPYGEPLAFPRIG